MPSSPINATHTNSTTIITHKRQQLRSQQAGCLIKCVIETYIFGLKCLTVKNSSSTPFTVVLAKCVLHTTVGTYLPFYEKKYIDSKAKLKTQSLAQTIDHRAIVTLPGLQVQYALWSPLLKIQSVHL